MSTKEPKTARHFEIGTVVCHGTFGKGVVLARPNGERYPYFAASKTTGTASTRVWSDSAPEPRLSAREQGIPVEEWDSWERDL